jgi:hypothetical protein
MKKIVLLAGIAAISVANAGSLKNEVACTAPNKQGTSGGYQFNIPCTQMSSMAGDFEDQGAFDPGRGICGKYVTPSDAPFNWDGPCGGSTAVGAQSNE